MQAENVNCLQDELKPNTIEFDFLGKDSVQYTKEMEVAPAVYRNIGKWTRKTVRGQSEWPFTAIPPFSLVVDVLYEHI